MLCERIKEIMRIRGVNQVELARLTGLSQQMVSLIVTGKTPDPGVSKVIKICQALDVPFELVVLDDVPLDELGKRIED